MKRALVLFLAVAALTVTTVGCGDPPKPTTAPKPTTPATTK